MPNVLCLICSQISPLDLYVAETIRKAVKQVWDSSASPKHPIKVYIVAINPTLHHSAHKPHFTCNGLEAGIEKYAFSFLKIVRLWYYNYFQQPFHIHMVLH